MRPLSRRARAAVVTLAVAAIVTAANASQGAYFSQSWGWVALAFLVPATVLLILERVATPGRLRIAVAALMCLLAGWTALSATWSISASGSIREVERTVVYVAVALAVAVILRRGDEPAIVAGALTGITLVSGYSLATRLFPDRFASYDDPSLPYRLSAPLGYWNALGLLAALGMLLALGLVAHSRRRATGVAAAALLPVLASTLYFTFSRGAWSALVLGYVAMVALDARRVRLLWTSLAVLPAWGACVVAASRQGALTTENSPAALALRQGHRQAAVTVAFVGVSALLALGARVVSDRVSVSRSTRRYVDVALVALAAVTIVAVVAAEGGPSRGLATLRARFDTDGPTVSPDLNSRLFSIAGNGRAPLIHVAWDAGKLHPFGGNGAGSYEYVWYRQRPIDLVVRDAHSLFVEMFSELGLVGLSILTAILVLLLAGGVRGRRSRFVPAGAAALVAWIVASSLDWHWEMVGLTMTALLVSTVGPIAAERGRSSRLRPPMRLAGIALGIALSVFAVDSLVGNQALFAGKDALARKDWIAARDDGRRARALLPWSYEPDLVVGDAAAGLGDRGGAVRAYRAAVDRDPSNWIAWLRLAQTARGTERARAYAKVRRLDPRERIAGTTPPSG